MNKNSSSKKKNVDEENKEKVNKKKRRDVLACICRDRKKEIKKYWVNIVPKNYSIAFDIQVEQSFT